MNEYFLQVINEGTECIKSVKCETDKFKTSHYYCDSLDAEMAVKAWELKVDEIVELYGMECHKAAMKSPNLHTEAHWGTTPIITLREKLEVLKRIADLDKVRSIGKRNE